MRIIKKKKETKFKITDVRQSDIDLMIASLSAPKDHIFCFGKAGIKLSALNLIDDDNKVTQDGIKMIRSFR